MVVWLATRVLVMDSQLMAFLAKKLSVIQAPKPSILGALSFVPPGIGGQGAPSTGMAFSRKHLSNSGGE